MSGFLSVLLLRDTLEWQIIVWPKNSVGSVVRGKKAYLEFRKLDLKNDQQIIIKTDSNEEVIRRYKKHIHRLGQEVKYKDRLGTGYPGLIE